ncbi:unnamed protein product [Vitrella brassicaformis CCMP3155]|uniref:BBSome-interacting protein 1 n=2 Tax=Vitrella brassicaformis TaxID=1169539 RepID=A0A0G4EJS8_VITBC|nr:unnamed protein product [Vitrella brassicaformis CCMP3155]|eukprot:CEL96648.1 unnamed protein product [Vitrella brassicaformis CCMP3155]
MASGGKMPDVILPKEGLLYSEKSSLSEVLCKPKWLPIKSVTLAKIELMEKQLAATMQQHQQAEQASTHGGNGHR